MMIKSNIKLLRESLLISRFPLLTRSGRREVYYGDIGQVAVSPPNGRSGASLIIRLKDESEIRVVLAEEKAKALKAELDEIVFPRAIRDKTPLPFDRIAGLSEELTASKGENIRKAVDFLLSQGICHEASDIQMEYREGRLEILFRIDGILSPVVRIERGQAEKIVNCIKVAAGLLTYRRDAIQEGRISQHAPDGVHDLRISVMPASSGERIAVRLFDKLKGESGLDDLGFTREELEKLKSIAAAPQGFFVICGPASSGKTTTLYAMLRHIQSTRGRLTNVITLEDPIEYRIPRITQVQIESRKGVSFHKALMSSLRQDPGVIMVGEIRDRETAEASVQAALTGHLVLSTIHCGSAAEAVSRLLDFGVRPALLSSTLKGTLCQRLVRKVCAACLRNFEMDHEALRLLGEDAASEAVPKTYVRGKGCVNCRGTGYRGRTVVSEFLQVNDRIAELIKTAPDTKTIEQAAAAQGMTPLRRRGAQMVCDAVTDPQEIARVLG